MIGRMYAGFRFARLVDHDHRVDVRRTLVAKPNAPEFIVKLVLQNVYKRSEQPSNVSYLDFLNVLVDAGEEKADVVASHGFSRHEEFLHHVKPQRRNEDEPAAGLEFRIVVPVQICVRSQRREDSYSLVHSGQNGERRVVSWAVPA